MELKIYNKRFWARFLFPKMSPGSIFASGAGCTYLKLSVVNESDNYLTAVDFEGYFVCHISGWFYKASFYAITQFQDFFFLFVFRFHVDKVSSAHVYLRLPKVSTWIWPLITFNDWFNWNLKTTNIARCLFYLHELYIFLKHTHKLSKILLVSSHRILVFYMGSRRCSNFICEMKISPLK